jgi:hypothetical protein
LFQTPPGDDPLALLESLHLHPVGQGTSTPKLSNLFGTQAQIPRSARDLIPLPILVPSKGLEPPHRCRYMDLNHARLPIPPRWQSGLQSSRQPEGGRIRKTCVSILQPRCALSNQPIGESANSLSISELSSSPEENRTTNQVDDRKTGGHDQPFIAGKEFSLAAPMQKQWSKANRNPCQRRYNGVGRRTDDFGQSRIYLDTYRSSVQPFLPAGQGTTRPYSSFALMVIFAFSTFDTGHPVSAASAYF